jgi:hypothetical protein
MGSRAALLQSTRELPYAQLPEDIDAAATEDAELLLSVAEGALGEDSENSYEEASSSVADAEMVEATLMIGTNAHIPITIHRIRALSEFFNRCDPALVNDRMAAVSLEPLRSTDDVSSMIGKLTELRVREELARQYRRGTTQREL